MSTKHPSRADRHDLAKPLVALASHLAAFEHESVNTTHRYVEANLAMKEQALAKLDAPDIKLKRFRADDNLMKFLKGL